MLIKGSDIEEGMRIRMLLRPDQVFEIREIEVGPGTGLRRFRLLKDEQNCGVLYENDISVEVLQQLS